MRGTRMLDITGQRFGKLTALHPLYKKNDKYWVWRTICDCGSNRDASVTNLRGGNVQSCGCIIRKHGLSRTPEWKTWRRAISACTNPKDRDYPRYGGRGIFVCNEWLQFENFLRAMGARPSPKLQLDRINNDDGYYKENCRWTTQHIQAVNRRSTLEITKRKAAIRAQM